MKFVAAKTADQLDLQALHRVRDRLVGQRTGVIRGHKNGPDASRAPMPSKYSHFKSQTG
jgi:hypothetical protein